MGSEFIQTNQKMTAMTALLRTATVIFVAVALKISSAKAQDISAWPGMEQVMEFKGLDAQSLLINKLVHVKDAVLIAKGWHTTVHLGKVIDMDDSVVLSGSVHGDFAWQLLEHRIQPSEKPRAFSLSDGGFLILVSESQLNYYVDLYLKKHG
jgi:hypothetical protein